MNTIVKRFGLSLAAAALFCLLGWAVPGAHAASQTSHPKMDPPSCPPNQVSVVGMPQSMCLAKGTVNQHFDSVTSIQNGADTWAVFYGDNGSTIIPVKPGGTKNVPANTPGAVSVSNCQPNQVTVFQRHAIVCLNAGQNASVIEVVAIQNGTNAQAMFHDVDTHQSYLILPGQTKTFPNFNSGTVTVSK